MWKSRDSLPKRHGKIFLIFPSLGGRIEVATPGFATPALSQNCVSRQRPVHNHQIRNSGEFPHVVRHYGAASGTRRRRNPQVGLTNGHAQRLQNSADGDIVFFDLSVGPDDGERCQEGRGRALWSVEDAHFSLRLRAIPRGPGVARERRTPAPHAVAASRLQIGHASRTPQY
jgi:hypothetical protein